MCCRLLACAVIALCLVAPASAQLENVGNLSFPTSAKPEAQRHFLRGVAILHSFGWKQAIAEFQAAQKLQPDFALAYWGESLSYNHPLNSQMDFKEPRAVLARLGPDRASRVAKAPTDREKGFMIAVEELWGEGDSRQRRLAYMTAMERLYKQFPNDDEVKTFYALSILSGASAVDDRTSRMNVKAGSLAMEVFKRNPSHPGAVHYIIHAFDDPVHAPLALEAAHTYAKIVPAVSHAVHMPTHIFIQHGMWNEVANQNILANGFSAVKTGDMATAEKMEALLAAKAKAAPGAAAAPANPHAEHGATPPPAAPAAAGGGPDAGKGVRVMHKELQALIAQAKGQGDQAITLLKEAAEPQETMR